MEIQSTAGPLREELRFSESWDMIGSTKSSKNGPMCFLLLLPLPLPAPLVIELFARRSKAYRTYQTMSEISE
jgi:hypothetical protein